MQQGEIEECSEMLRSELEEFDSYTNQKIKTTLLYYQVKN